MKARKRGKPQGNKSSPKKWTWSQKYEGEWKPSPCMIHPNNRSQVGEGLLYEALGKNVSNFLCKWEILQGYHLIIYQALDVVHVYLNVFGPLSLH